MHKATVRWKKINVKIWDMPALFKKGYNMTIFKWAPSWLHEAPQNSMRPRLIILLMLLVHFAQVWRQGVRNYYDVQNVNNLTPFYLGKSSVRKAVWFWLESAEVTYARIMITCFFSIVLRLAGFLGRYLNIRPGGLMLCVQMKSRFSRLKLRLYYKLTQIVGLCARQKSSISCSSHHLPSHWNKGIQVIKTLWQFHMIFWGIWF